jgi:stage V sporulation protein G
MRKINKLGKLKAVSSVIIDGLIVIHNIKIIERSDDNSLIVIMPNRKNNKDSNKDDKDIAHPINASSRTYFENTILSIFGNLNVSGENSIEVKVTDEYDLLSERQIQSVLTNIKTFAITSITIRKFKTDNRCKGVASVVLDDEFVINGIKLIIGEAMTKKYLGMPSEKKGDKWNDIVHPINPDLRNQLEQLIFAIYGLIEDEESNTFFFVAKNIKNCIFNQISNDFEISDTRSYQANSNYDLEKLQSGKDFQQKEKTKFEDPKIRFCNNIEIINIDAHPLIEIYKGRIVGFYNQEYYLIKFESDLHGIIKCREFDSLYKMIDFANNVTKEFIIDHKNLFDVDSNLQQYIDKYFYFEKTGLSEDRNLVYSIKNIRYIFLNNLIDNELITNGKILNIDYEKTIIVLDYGWVFITKTYRILHPYIDKKFDLSKFQYANISICIIYNQEKNLLFPVIADIYSYWAKENMFVFPVLNNFKGILESQLALNKKLRFIDRNEKFVSKGIGHNLVIKKLRFNNESDRYRANIVKILNKNMDFILRQSLSLTTINNLIGYKLQDAVEYLTENNILYSYTYEYSRIYNEDIICKMIPTIKNKAVVPHNIIVQLTVSKGEQREYVIPNFVGRKIDDVIKELKDYNLRVKYIIHNNPISDVVGENYLTGSRPVEGTHIYSNNRITLYIYKKQTNNSPFRTFENEELQHHRSSQVIGTEYDFLIFSKIKWQAVMAEIILKHKSITTYHLRTLLLNISCYNVSEQDVDDALEYLLKKSFVGGASTKANRIFTSNQKYLYPLNKLYSVCKNNYIDTGRFHINNWQATNFKVRSSENQTLIKLIQVTRQMYSWEYFIDKIQNYDTQECEQTIRIHFWVNLFNEYDRKVFIIESIRFYEFDIEANLADKFLRYNDLFSERYNITPSIIIVFEDNEHAQFFFENYSHVFSKSKYNILYTFDELTNSSDNNFDKIFIEFKGEQGYEYR